MTSEQLRKIGRYFLNADPFLWGVLRSKIKKGRIKELQERGYLSQYTKGSNPIYTRLNRDLLVELGVKGYWKKLLCPEFRNSLLWKTCVISATAGNRGKPPNLNTCKNTSYMAGTYSVTVRCGKGFGEERVTGYKDPAFIFVHIEPQFNIIQRWTVFAGLWFEEIEPSLG